MRNTFPFMMLAGIVFASQAANKIHPRLEEEMRVTPSSEPHVAWVFFTDKGSHELYKGAVPHDVVSRRSFLRRLKSLPADNAVDYTDLPVEQSYVQQLAEKVIRVRQISRWFNGVSVVATTEQLHAAALLSCVLTIEPLARFRRDTPENNVRPTSPEPRSMPDEASGVPRLDYGLSYDQLALINVPAVHDMGNYGQGVIIGSFDNGFRLLNHEAFDTLRTRIVATYDFVDHKVSVVPENPSPGFGAHGIITLSTMAGYKPGQLIGPAFGASFILARTENDSSETPVEEDNWVAAMEWADSIGVDVTSTSLGYLTYDAPYPSWTWQDMNGTTTVISRAATMAVRKGIVVCNSAGNNGFNASHNTLNAPADADSILSVGAANPNGTRASFSSVGPTTSIPPRIKPDVMAQGVSVRCASPTVPDQYTYDQGTSLSCPLAAGIAALLIHAKPNASAVEIMNTMRLTSDNASSPDNLVGWGLLDALSAITGVRHGDASPVSFRVDQNFPNPFNPGTTIAYTLPDPAEVTLTIYDVLGREVRTLVQGPRPGGTQVVTWDGTTSEGISAATGAYLYRLVAITPDRKTYTETRKLTLLR